MMRIFTRPYIFQYNYINNGKGKINRGDMKSGLITILIIIGAILVFVEKSPL